MTDDAVAMVLPFPPSNNTYYRHVVISSRPRTLISKKGREYRKSVVSVARTRKTFSGELHVMIWLYPPDRRKRDIDNFAGKALLDSLTHAGVWTDDSQVKQLDIKMCMPNKKHPHAVVIISTIEDENEQD